MKKLHVGDPDTTSRDLVANNIEQLKLFFPDVWSEGKIDFAVLRQLLGDRVDDSEERYGLNWRGKRLARALAIQPSNGTLRPAPDESVDWDTTQNLMIEGDNLEVLKLLQKSYQGCVKAAYIDPPYNTGKDFVYPDSYEDSIANYLSRTGQVLDGERVASNPESSGRFHTNWLNMLYPRLLVARGCLRDDGVLFVSIDEKEMANVRLLCNGIFGEECFAGVLVVHSNRKGRSQDKYFATNHEYVVVYSKQVLPKGAFAIAKEEEQVDAEYPEVDEIGQFRWHELRNTHREYGKRTRPNLFFPIYVAPSGEVSLEALTPEWTKALPLWPDGYEGCWTWERNKVTADIELLGGRLVDGQMKVFRKVYASGAERMLKTILESKSFTTERGQKEFNALFGAKDKLFQSPKSPFLLAELFKTCTSGDDLILDFFAGSGTTAHATWMLNAEDGGRRRCVLVQLPEALSEDNPNQRAAAAFCTSIGKAQNLVEITKERLRRSAASVRAANPGTSTDLGFRVFKLDSSNIRPWDPAARDLDNALLDSVEHVKPERGEQDVLFELMLKLGINLAAPVTTRIVAGTIVWCADGGRLFCCLAKSIPHADVSTIADDIIAWHTELAPSRDTTVIFRDSAFAQDATKANLAARLKQRGLMTVRSI